MRYVFAIDTCGPVIGAALWADGIVTVREARVQRGAEALLVPWFLELCANAGIATRQVEGLGVAVGPGAFTGVRVGVATAGGLAQGLDVPVFCADGLVTRAMAVLSVSPVLSILDAKKGRVYAAWVQPNGEILGDPADILIDEAVHEARPPFWATGEGALVYRDVVEAAGGWVWHEAGSSAVETLVTMTQAALQDGRGVPVAQVRPHYLRDADAVPRREGV
jgi:tRNA threonylcarbamoyladenosine biosynthesis protein TsaB